MKSYDVQKAQDLLLKIERLNEVLARTYLPPLKKERVRAFFVRGSSCQVILTETDDRKEAFDAVQAEIERRIEKAKGELLALGVDFAAEPLLEGAVDESLVHPGPLPEPEPEQETA